MVPSRNCNTTQHEHYTSCNHNCSSVSQCFFFFFAFLLSFLFLLPNFRPQTHHARHTNNSCWQRSRSWQQKMSLIVCWYPQSSFRHVRWWGLSFALTDINLTIIEFFLPPTIIHVSSHQSCQCVLVSLLLVCGQNPATSGSHPPAGGVFSLTAQNSINF